MYNYLRDDTIVYNYLRDDTIVYNYLYNYFFAKLQNLLKTTIEFPQPILSMGTLGKVKFP